MRPRNYQIEPCAPAERVEAIRRLHAGLSADQRIALPPALDMARSQGDDWSGLLVAKSSHGITATVWVQLAPGRTAMVWPPAVGHAAGPDLMRAAARFLDERQIVLAQILVSPDAPRDQEAMIAGRFYPLVELVYLAIEREFLPEGQPTSRLTFIPFASEHPERLESLLLETYEGTLDCPQLNGVRAARDVLAGYLAQGEFAPERWFFVEHHESDVGLLLLNAHPGKTWELVYMGVVPAQRGRGYGGQIVRRALAQAAVGGAERVVLAVDEANAPGLAMYRAAGFVPWDRRTVLARIRRT